MKRGVEKTEATERKRIRRQSSPLVKSTPSLPLDLTSEIFLHLPAKYVVRFHCVSKLWSTITTQPYFKNTFEARSNLLLFFKDGDKLLFSRFLNKTLIRMSHICITLLGLLIVTIWHTQKAVPSPLKQNQSMAWYASEKQQNSQYGTLPWESS